jgi:glycolate oxidase
VRGYTAAGEAVTFGSEALDAPGYDLMSVLVGSEGMLAVIVEATVRLIPKPQVARCIMASFDDIRKAGDAVANVIAAGIIPAGLEMLDKPMAAAVEGFVHAGYDLEAAAILLCESDGNIEEVEEEIGRMVAVMEGSGASRIEVSENEAQRLRFWSGRKNAFPPAAASAPTTCAWTRRSRASASPTCCSRSRRWSRPTRCAASTCSMPATATCTR